MRIRKRAALSSLSSSSYPYFISPTQSLQSLVSDPGLQPPHGGEGNGGGAGGEKAAAELHQDGDLKVPHPLLARAGQVQQKMEEEMVKREGGMEEEEEREMGWSKRWHPQINSNKSESGSSSALALQAWQKKSSCCDGGGNGDKERRSKATAAKARAKGGAASVAGGNNCTSGGVNGSDSEGCNIGGATTPFKGQSSGGGGAAAAAVVTVNASGKRRRSPAVLMEGSRCSRVNGRGWRCCQQTLVGYSLCEHHLGKGRLRSMTTVRGQIGATTRPKSNNAAAALPSPPPPLGSINGLKETKQGEDELEEEIMGRKKIRIKKIGMVKARSISSLLDAVDHVTAAAMAPPPEFAPTPRFTAAAGAGANA